MLNAEDLVAPKSFIMRCLEEGHMQQKDLAEGLGVSPRTISRWLSSGTIVLLPHRYRDLSRAMYPRNPALAAEIAALGGTTLVALGIAPPEIPAPSTAPPLLPGERPVAPLPAHADAVLCTVAERLDVSPRQLRPILAAAFARAHELGFSTEQLARAFAQPQPNAPSGKPVA